MPWRIDIYNNVHKQTGKLAYKRSTSSDVVLSWGLWPGAGGDRDWGGVCGGKRSGSTPLLALCRGDGIPTKTRTVGFQLNNATPSSGLNTSQDGQCSKVQLILTSRALTSDQEVTCNKPSYISLMFTLPMKHQKVFTSCLITPDICMYVKQTSSTFQESFRSEGM